MNTTTATMTESEAKAFVDQAAHRLVEEFKAHYVYLTIYTSRYGGDFPKTTLGWASTIDHSDQISANTLDELMVKLHEASGPSAKLAKIAELRKQADELEASIQQEVVNDEPDYDAPKPLTPMENMLRNDEHHVR